MHRHQSQRERLIDAGLWVLSALLVAALAVLSLFPAPPVGGPRPADLFLHAAAYAPTTFALLLAAVWRPGRGEGAFPGMTVLFVVALLCLGTALEVVQGLGWVGPRQGEVADALANGTGVLLGWTAWTLVRRWTFGPKNG